jgi:hypothetical protein
MPQSLSVSWFLVVQMITGNVLGGLVPRQRSGGLEAIGSRHHDIHQHQVGLDLFGALDCPRHRFPPW